MSRPFVFALFRRAINKVLLEILLKTYQLHGHTSIHITFLAKLRPNQNLISIYVASAKEIRKMQWYCQLTWIIANLELFLCFWHSIHLSVTSIVGHDGVCMDWRRLTNNELVILKETDQPCLRTLWSNWNLFLGTPNSSSTSEASH